MERRSDAQAPDNGTVVWQDVALREGKNDVVAVATMKNGTTVTDQCEWTYTPGAPQEVYVAQDDQMRQCVLARPPRAR